MPMRAAKAWYMHLVHVCGGQAMCISGLAALLAVLFQVISTFNLHKNVMHIVAIQCPTQPSYRTHAATHLVQRGWIGTA